MPPKSTNFKSLGGIIASIDRTQTFNINCGPVAVFVALICLVYGWLAYTTERSSHEHYLQESRAIVAQEAALIASRLEAEVNSSFFLIAGLASYIGLNEEIAQEEYARICERMYPAIPGLVNIAAAPDLVNKFVYPLKGNEAIIGMDYEALPDQIGAINQIKDSRQPLIAGPVELVQGGQAIIGRFPVFTVDELNEAGTFWGIISTPILTDSLYREADLPLNSSSLEFALRGKDGLGAKGEVFLGEEDLFHSAAVLFPVHFFRGSWEMALAPKAGWPEYSPSRWLIYGVYLAICLLSVLLFVALCLYLRRVNEAHEVERSVRLVKERFYSNMSHEIRTPLNAILGLSEIISETTEESYTKENIEIICNSARALTELISDVLFLSEEAVSKGPPPCGAFDANDLLQEVLSPIIPEVNKKQLTLHLVKLPADQAEVYSSKQHVRQILWNLALNAVKFTNEGTVTLRLYLKGNTLCFQCTDTGVGIKESYQSQLYDAFTQEDSSRTRQFEGAGLGLSIVKRSVDVLKGKISFESVKGESTTFWVEIPLADARDRSE